MTDLFDFSTDEITVEIFNDSPIYIIDNFYKNPEKVIDYIESHDAILWKKWETPTFNGNKFYDYRHNIVDDRMLSVTSYLGNLCNQQCAESNKIVTNKISFKDYEFNDYFNNFWAPHRDMGYNGIIYFNKEETYTNLYSEISEDSWSGPEHFSPWRPKSFYKIEKKLVGIFNRCILFDGKKFLHGMDISNDCYFANNFRFNQVMFFMNQ
jgi:hypothetical protein